MPSDKICHNLKIKDRGRRRLKVVLWVVVPFSVVLGVVLLVATSLPFLFSVAIGATPLLVPGVLAKRVERSVLRREHFFPAFVRTLGSAVRARNGAVLSSLKIVLVHDFGLVNELMHNLYKRLKLGCDKVESWVYYAAESGSHLIHMFSKIFAESIYLGGDGEKIGEIVSKNFQRLISLRLLRLQLASGLRGSLYGSLVGFAAAIYVTAKISAVLSDIFSQPVGDLTVMQGFLDQLNLGVTAVDMARVSMLIGVLVIVHSAASAWTLKIVDGGLTSAALVDVVIMLWIGAALSWFIPVLTDSIMPTFGVAAGPALQVPL
ncbi:hypothetical protein D6783_05685 [Candidatus Woesearchaeota archaeon]|nr:MAG: hypothetical protein D6783_05685 [Candidatus Woesearchaeota archaeon]